MRRMHCCAARASTRRTARAVGHVLRWKRHMYHEAEASRARAALRDLARARGGCEARARCSTACTGAATSDLVATGEQLYLHVSAAGGNADGCGRVRTPSCERCRCAQAQLPVPPKSGRAGCARVPEAPQRKLRSTHAQNRRPRRAPQRDRAGGLPRRGAVRLRSGDHRAHRARGRLHHGHGGALLRYQAGHHDRGAAADPAAHRGAPHAGRGAAGSAGTAHRGAAGG